MRTGRWSANQTVPARRRTTGGSPLETLTRLFLLQLAVPREQAERALPGLVDELGVAGLLATSVGEVAARNDCRPTPSRTPTARAPTAGWSATSRRHGRSSAPRRHRPRPGRQLGLDLPGAADAAPRRDRRPRPRHGLRRPGLPPRRARRQGRGHRRQPPRAVGGPLQRRPQRPAGGRGPRRLVLRAGARRAVRPDHHQPAVRDLPATGERLVYRDSGIPGDRVVEDIVRRAPDHLRPGGWCQVLANWAHLDGVGWDERIAGWLAPGTDALVVQREVLDPAAYVELWLADAGVSGATDGAERDRRYDTWLSWFDEQGITGVGFGWINLRTDGSGRRELLDWPWDVEQPVAPAIAAWGAARVGVGPRRHAAAGRRRAAGDGRPARRRGPRVHRAAPAHGPCAARVGSTRRPPPWSVPATATCAWARSSMPWRGSSARTPTRSPPACCPSSASWPRRLPPLRMLRKRVML